MKVYFILLLSIILVSTIPLSFAPSHPIGGEQPIDDMDTVASSQPCETVAPNNQFCDIVFGTVDCDNPITAFHTHAEGCSFIQHNAGLNLAIMAMVFLGIVIIVLILLRRRN